MTVIYVLRLEQNKWYVVSVPQLIEEPLVFFREYSDWTKKYKPIAVDNKYYNIDNEDKYTKCYMAQYGIHNVRGGSYQTIELEQSQIMPIIIESNYIKDHCIMCGGYHTLKECQLQVKYDDYHGILGCHLL